MKRVADNRRRQTDKTLPILRDDSSSLRYSSSKNNSPAYWDFEFFLLILTLSFFYIENDDVMCDDYQLFQLTFTFDPKCCNIFDVV